ncbi:hypothetical protein APR41_02205 [Salegentibacter salinarum]|uniref:SMODS and SLOG-associating 2TM effector domain-containing protein n=1 Tax=Salegentibacter salinarum TaxID=447422 RepID=A0A2N0U4A0_9FLAO|nr:mobilome CxxCx(11)CxxC protein [Salegentibacter salinarum]PKD21814.1 hypothetical protein APR41_02205 [Salegentibacter salinarum]SKB33347.1 mobilome CxxCx(11)CxxC protein [Salegentibacter salinarum]
MNEEILRKESWNKALQSFGKAYIFSQRAEFYKKWIRSLTWLGIIIPLMIGGIAMGYGYNSSILDIALSITIPVITLQLGISAFALVNNWSDYLSYSLEATNDYNSLSESFKKIAINPPKDSYEHQKLYDILETKYSLRMQQDSKYGLKDRELRRGMRSGLREFQRECVACRETPLSMQSTSCQICGNFTRNLIQRIFYHG